MSAGRILLLGLALTPVLALVGCAGGLPVHVVEEHDEMVLALLESRRSGRIEGPVTLVHVDAHADLGLPTLGEALHGPAGEDEEHRRLRLERLVNTDLAVDDVLVPAVMLGLVKDVVWATPTWLGEAPREERIEIGSRGGRGRVFARADTLDEVVYPDRRVLRLTVRPMNDLPRIEGPWVLGIDLDAFECRNPHASHLDRDATEDEARRLLSAGEIVDRGACEEDGANVVSTLVKLPDAPWPRRVDRVEDDAGVRWRIGWPCMGRSRDTLPEHEATPGEWDAALAGLVTALARMPTPPVLVVISRSAGTGFVPRERVGALLARVEQALDTFVRTRPSRYPEDRRF